MKSENYNVVWFKRDLRIHDHAPFFEASKDGSILPIYIVEPQMYKLPDVSSRHWCFIHDCLTDLEKNLKNLGGNLTIRVGDVISVMKELLSKLGNFTLYSHEETGNAWTYQRDEILREWCNINGVIWQEFPTNGVVRKLRCRDSWSITRDKRMSKPITPCPNNVKFIQGILSDPLPIKDHYIFGGSLNSRIQKGGRYEAIKILNSFLSNRSKNYMHHISKPGISEISCSRLSPHITFGTLSVREIEQATKNKINSLLKVCDANVEFLSRNLEAFRSRLAWHCHFIQKLEQQPEIEFKCTHSAFEGMREPYFREDFFDAWKNGNTGYPLIDACMRSLHESGWITFRMRALVVSFASYDLFLDWRKTAPFLATLFTDYEPGIHYSQFQMQSGVTGINTFRIYNPIKQSYDQDKEAKFIRRYIPELNEVPNHFIHEPWKMGQQIKGYPKRIIDHQRAIKNARLEIGKRLKTDGFREQSKLIVEKLGSRNRLISRTRKVSTINPDQLSLNLK